MEVAPFFVNFHHFLTIFTIYALLSRFTFCRDLHTFSANFFSAKIASPQHHTFFACMPADYNRMDMPGGKPLRISLSQISICYYIFFNWMFCTWRARALRALGLLLADGTPTGGTGDFLSRQPNFFTETAVTPERKVEKSFPRWEINRHVEG